MTPGLSFFYGGMVGKKNVISTIQVSLLWDTSILWIVVLAFLFLSDESIGFEIDGVHYGFYEVILLPARFS
ncbi:hypothetical protein [Chryseobacterium indoltheticum]|uniref:hypothetical protein n=1 Tax=Chryseobacterium indoltheticum TaxID=254 RepID=UPI003F498D62